MTGQDDNRNVAPRRSRLGPLWCAVALLGGTPLTVAGSLEWQPSSPGNYDFGRQLTIPAGFGSGEFTLELWIKLNDAFPVGSTAGGSEQLTDWSSADLAPYSSDSWWFEGNFLLDGHNNANSNFQDGTFSIQLHGGGRVRWLFGDGSSIDVPGRVWSVGAHPASNAPSLIDGRWHHLALVRRFTTGAGAQLELWVDGALVDSEKIPARTNMRKWWDNWSGYYADQRGWFWGAEKQAAIGSLPQYEDYKGLLDDVRFWTRARTTTELGAHYAVAVTGNESGLVGWYDFNEGAGDKTCSSIVKSQCISLVGPAPKTWNSAEAPAKPGAE